MDWGKLGKLVLDRRVEIGFRTREKFAVHAALSSRLLGDIENGRRGSYDPATLVRLERALGWEKGSVEAVLSGGTPTLGLVDPPLVATPSDAPPQRTPAGIWIVEAEPPSLPDLAPHVRPALLTHALALQDRLERDLLLITMRLAAATADGFLPANPVEARMLIHELAPVTAREKPWKLTVAVAELDQVYLGAPADTQPRLDEFPWEQMSDPTIRPITSVQVFTSPDRLCDYNPNLVPLPVAPADLVRAWPDKSAVLNVNPGSRIGYTASTGSLVDAVHLVADEVGLDPAADA